ncbi:unnamed protein product [Rotaria sp. Silwood1]|nr:unnamed protein product [Rotaria sp. Silwood1]
MKYSVEVPINVYGILKPTGCKFLRIDSRLPMKDLYQFILEDCGGQKPALILSIYGGVKYSTMTRLRENEFIIGVIHAATMANAWILTVGVNNGISKLVGEGISQYRLLQEYANKVKCIGMTMWGTMDEDTHLELKKASSGLPSPLCERQIPDNAEEYKETIEKNHTHCILFDSGRLYEYLSDSQRHQFVMEACKDKDQDKDKDKDDDKKKQNDSNNDHTCYAVTIIVEGGLGSLEVLENDIQEKRPIVLIQGSGRLADLLAMLVEQTSNSDRNQYQNPSDQEIEQVLRRFFPSVPNSEVSTAKGRIQKILQEENRYLLYVFCMNRDKNVDETIFKAIFAVTKKKNELEHGQKTKNESQGQETQLPKDEHKQRSKDEDKLVHLALEWNYFDGASPILLAQQDEMMEIRNEIIRIQSKSMKIERDSEKSHKNRVKTLFGRLPLKSIRELDYKLNKFVGSFFGPIYSFENDNIKNRIQIDLKNHVCTCCGSYEHVENNNKERNDQANNKYTKHHVLRDLFLLSVFMDMSELAKILLFHVRSCICAALIASAVFKRYSESSQTVYLKTKFLAQSSDFEKYAAKFLGKCYKFSEECACELLLRQIPLFGNVTCMQVAISSESKELLNTAYFDQTLNQVWFNKLSLTNSHTTAKLLQIPSILTIGFIAPMIISYREEDEESTNNTANNALSEEGINYYVDRQQSKQDKCTNYWTRFRYFHESPLIKMSYHFISYVWFLLVFSYMMLYHLDGRNTFIIPHWTEIYVIITVSTMFCEESRRLYHEYNTRMTERWGSTGSAFLTVLSNAFYIMPYILFYLGLGFRYGSYNESLLTTARIIWALDLELWYLRSLKFVIAVKFLGLKLFMLKNMLRDLFAFVYMIFIAIAAYGVVSRSLILYKQVPFTGRDIFGQIFYEPYWLLYGDVSDKNLLDDIINSNSSNATGNVAEATATHVLLAFHMLFINILLLSLITAVFAHSIDEVRENTEFYWRYQRYSFVREYFERLPLSYPPFIAISHVVLLLLTIHREFCSLLGRHQVAADNHVPLSKKLTRVFKMIPTNDSQNEQWDSFENAATHSCIRSILEKSENQDTSTTSHEKPSKNNDHPIKQINDTTASEHIEGKSRRKTESCNSFN